MTDLAGYVRDVRYPAFFHKEMQPLWLTSVATMAGLAAPDPARPFRLCELGCGLGINLLVAAACHPDAQFVGVDGNADHLAFAQAAARACDLANVSFVAADFAAFARTNTATFDLVTCHGTWSWIAPEHQDAVLATVAASLAPQGLFALHYMCHPGSTDLAALQHLMHLCGQLMPGPSPRRARTGLALLEQMAQAGLYHARPDMAQHLANLARRDPADLAHEFLTDHWRPEHSAHLHARLAGAGLDFVASGDVFANLDIALSVPAGLQPLLRRTAVPVLAETLKDMARHAHQRIDLFQRADGRTAGAGTGAGAGDPAGQARRLAALRWARLPGAPAAGPVTFATPIGPITGSAAIFTPLLQCLAQGPATLADLAGPMGTATLPQQLEALQLLMMAQWAHPTAPEPQGATGADNPRAGRLAQWFDQAGLSLDIIAACATAMPRPAR